MTRFYTPRVGEAPLALVHTRETLQFREKLKVLKPTSASLLSPGVINMGREITGCLVLRLNRQTLPALMLLVTGLITGEDHLTQTRGLFYHDLETSPRSLSAFQLIRDENRDLSLLEDLTLSGFCLSARRREAVLLKLEVLGSRLGDFAFGKEGTPALAAEAFLRLEGDEVRVDDFLIPDLAAFSVTGVFSSQMKKHELMIRRKDQESSDYSMMRQTLSSRIILTSRDSYEENQRVRLEVTIDQASYRGELSYPDNKGIWGREFRYTLTGPLKIRVFTHLEGRGIKI